MKRWHGGLVLALALAWTAPGPAQLFGKKTKPNPSQRVPELILIVKTDPDDRKRTQAAEELRDYDVTVFAEIIPILADVLQHDKKVNVRYEAVNSLTKIRPVSAPAGQALEKAAASDESLRIRVHAKTALAKYHLAGYSPKKADPPPSVQKKTTDEPPLADPLPRPLPKVTASPSQGPSLFP
jgi:hypothetical protein